MNTLSGMPKNLTSLINIVDIIAILIGECERGLLQINFFVISPQIAALFVRMVASLLFIKFNGLPLTIFKSLEYMLAHQKASFRSIDLNSKTQKLEQIYDQSMRKIWKIFD